MLVLVAILLLARIVRSTPAVVFFRSLFFYNFVSLSLLLVFERLQLSNGKQTKLLGASILNTVATLCTWISVLDPLWCCGLATFHKLVWCPITLVYASKLGSVNQSLASCSLPTANNKSIKGSRNTELQKSKLIRKEPCWSSRHVMRGV